MTDIGTLSAMHRPAIATAAVILLVLTGCSSTQPASEPEPTETPTGCLTPTAGAIDKLWADITATTGSTERLGTGVAKSPDSDITFIAIRFNDGTADYTGIWGTMQDPTTEDDIAYVAVDEVAEASGTYLQPVGFDKVGVLLDGAKNAEACII